MIGWTAHLPLDVPLIPSWDLRIAPYSPHGMFDIGPDIEDTFVYQMLEFSTPHVVRISLFALDLLSLSDDGNTCIRSKGRRCLESLLFPLTFSSLQHLDLRGWPLPEGIRFEEFLSMHSSSLRELRLVECVVTEDPRRLGQWTGKSMLLNGVEIQVHAKAEKHCKRGELRH